MIHVGRGPHRVVPCLQFPKPRPEIYAEKCTLQFCTTVAVQDSLPVDPRTSQRSGSKLDQAKACGAPQKRLLLPSRLRISRHLVLKSLATGKVNVGLRGKWRLLARRIVGVILVVAEMLRWFDQRFTQERLCTWLFDNASPA